MKINTKGIDFISSIRKDAYIALYVIGPFSIIALLMILLGYNSISAYLLGIPQILLLIYILYYLPLVRRKNTMDSLLTEINVFDEHIELKISNYLTLHNCKFLVSWKNLKIDTECSFPLSKGKKALKITDFVTLNKDFYLVYEFYNQKDNTSQTDEIISLLKLNLAK